MNRRTFLQSLARVPIAGPLALSRSNAFEFERRRSSHADVIEAGMQSIGAEIDRADADFDRPVYHFRSPSRWHNDPCGIAFRNGWYHLFYQMNPYASTWERMHWGHARSRNLVDWEHLPLALAPEPTGEYHMFTGSTWADSRGELLLVYQLISSAGRSIRTASPIDPEWMRFEKSNKILIDQTTHAPLAFNDWSDPFLFQKDGRTFITCGGNERRTGGRAVIHLYEGSADLTQWKHLGPIHVSPDRAAYNIECTNLMKIGDKWVLLYSAHRPAEYYVGDLDIDNRQFRIERSGVLDAGSSYAARFSALPTGEVIVWNWIPTNMPADRAWNGAMAMPRIVTIDDDRCLRQHPWRSFEKLRGARSSMPDFELLNGVVALDTSFAGSSCELRIRFSRVTADTVGLRFRCAEGKAPGAEVRFRRRDGSLAVNQRYAFYSREDEITLSVYLDRRIIEVFTANGTVALATLVSAGQDAAGIEVFATGGNATVSDLEFWPMTPASFSLEHFQ